MEEAEKKSSSAQRYSRGETYKHNSCELENDVVALLEKLNLSQLHDVFERSEVTMEDLETFNDQDLDCIGVRKYAYKKKILDAVKGKSQETHQQSKYQESSRPSETVENTRQASNSPEVHQPKYQESPKLSETLDNRRKASKSAVVQRHENLSNERLTGHLEDHEFLLLTSSGPAAEYRGKY